MKEKQKNDPNANYAMYEADRAAKRNAQPSLPATAAGAAPRVLKKIPYGNYTFSVMLNGDVIATRFGQYAGTFGSAKSAQTYVDSLIQ